MSRLFKIKVVTLLFEHTVVTFRFTYSINAKEIRKEKKNINTGGCDPLYQTHFYVYNYFES